MIATWYSILTFMLLMFVVLEGFDIGAGMLQYVVGKNDEERRTVIAAIGPLWSWHEVWLIGFGGTLLLAFPAIMATALSGFYLAFMLLLWGLIFRGISIEFSGHISDPLWRTGWHRCFVASNVLLAILIGAALGNILRGVPIDASGTFALSFFTNFSPHKNVGILDWYTLSVAAGILLLFAGHGAIGLAYRTTGPVHDRSQQLAARLWKIIPVVLIAVAGETWEVHSGLFQDLGRQPVGWVGMLLIVAGLLSVYSGLHAKNDSRALFGSGMFIAGSVIAGAAGLFPFMLYSTLAPRYSLSAYNNAAAGYGLYVALIWWPIALLLSLGYSAFIYRQYTGKVQLSRDTQTPY